MYSMSITHVFVRVCWVCSYPTSARLNGPSPVIGCVGSSAHYPPDKTIKVWDTAAGKCVRTLTGHESSVLALLALPSVSSGFRV